MEYFITANSFAAPFFSDSSNDYQVGDSPDDALKRFAKRYNHPCGLYSAAVYKSADDMHKGRKPLAMWLCNHAAKLDEATKGLGAYSCRSNGPGEFEIDGQLHKVKNPKGGKVIAAPTS